MAGDRVSDKSLSDLVTGGRDPLADFPEKDFPPKQGPLAPPQIRAREIADRLQAGRSPFGGFLGALGTPASAAMAVPGGLGVQAALQPAVGAAESLMKGEGVRGALGSAALSELGALGGGLLGKGYELVRNAPLFRKAVTEAAEQAAAKTGFDKAMTNALNATEARGHKQAVQGARNAYAERLRGERAAYKQGKQALEQGHEAEVSRLTQAHEAATRAHADQAAAKVAEEATRAVPAWKDYPKDTKGLLDMVYGTGQQKLSEAFDKAMQEVVAKGRGQKIVVAAEDAAKLKLPVLGQVANKVTGATDQVVVDAGQLAEKAVGAWRKDPGLYRRVVGTLDKANLGDPEARAAYRSGQAFITYIDQTKALQGEVFRPDRITAGFTRLSTVDQLRRRGAGDIFSGPMQAARGVPPAPVLPPKPVVPPFVPPPKPQMPLPPVPRVAPPPTVPPAVPPGFRVTPNPIAGHPYAAGAAAEALLAGAGLGHGYGLPFVGGMMAARSLPPQLVTQAPGAAPVAGPAAAGTVGLLRTLGYIP